MATILEALQNAETNISNIPKLGMVLVSLASNQLHNAIVLLEKGYKLPLNTESNI